MSGFSQLDVLRALDLHECRHINQVGAILGATENKPIVRVVGDLIHKGLAARREVGCYVLTPDGAAFLASGKVPKPGPKGKLTGSGRRPRRRTTQDKAWDALRVLGKASVPEIVELVGTEGSTLARINGGVQRFLRKLAQAGYLRELPIRAKGTALTSNGFRRWTLIRDTGPLCPLLTRHGVVDRNEGTDA